MNKIIQYGSVEAIPLYNCSAMPSELWSLKYGEKREIVGFISIFYGVIMEVLFIPCLIIILDKDLYKLSCYKIMFFNGIIDMLALAMNSIFTGILAVKGAVYCTYPTVIYIGGMLGLGLWCCSCLSNIVLLLNRTMNVSNSHLGEVMFKGNRTYLILLIPLFYGLYFSIFTSTFAFSSKYYAWFYDPFIFPNRTSEYTNISHGINNFMIMTGTCLFYAYISYALIKAGKAATQSRIQGHTILYQSIAICIIRQISSSVYVIMNFIIVPEWLIMLAQYLWQLDHGAPLIIYLTMNPTMRRRFLRKRSITMYGHSLGNNNYSRNGQ